MKEDFVLCLDSSGFHRMHYCEWGDEDNPRVLLCVHGLTRTGRDFDFLAQALESDYRVVCPDVAGRGRSEWLETKADYSYAQYCGDITALIARVTGGVRGTTIDWVGTSMGALLGIILAARRGTPIRKLVLNDAGMFVPKAALERLGRYVGLGGSFESLDALEAEMRRVCAPFGPLSDAHWRHLTVHGARQNADGTWTSGYDPAIRAPFDGEIADVDLSPYWNAVRCPTLVIRGAQSDVLLAETAAAMASSGPHARVVEIEGVGHAPMLTVPDQIALVREFLLGNEAP